MASLVPKAMHTLAKGTFQGRWERCFWLHFLGYSASKSTCEIWRVPLESNYFAKLACVVYLYSIKFAALSTCLLSGFWLVSGGEIWKWVSWIWTSNFTGSIFLSSCSLLFCWTASGLTRRLSRGKSIFIITSWTHHAVWAWPTEHTALMKAPFLCCVMN